MKSSTVFVAVGDKTSVYRSMEDVPAPLRKKLVATTSSLNSATILIADRRGREEIFRAIRGLPTDMQGRLLAALGARGLDPRASRPAIRFPLPHWAVILLSGAIGLLLWRLLAGK